MKKAPAKGRNDDLRPEYDLSQLKGGVRGKYYREATAGTNLVLIEHELADVFPDSESVNRALRLLVNTAAAAGSRYSTPSTWRLEPSREVGKTRPLSSKAVGPAPKNPRTEMHCPWLPAPVSNPMGENRISHFNSLLVPR
jgi:hypothetical protein